MMAANKTGNYVSMENAIVCVHKSFCFPLVCNYTKQREKARQRACK